MKKLLDKLGAKQENTNSLVGKSVAISNYVVRCEELIGEGGYASIYRATDQRTGSTFALKHMRLNSDVDQIKEVQQEAMVMAKLSGHKNILKLHAVAFAGTPGKETDGFFLLEYCGSTLLDLMQRTNFQLDDFVVYEVFSEVCQGVAHMHRQPVPWAHRDIKAENVLRNGEGRWVLCDFGSSTQRAQVYETPAEIAMEEEIIRRTTTPAYRAPEMWDLMGRQRIDTKADIWALGVLLYVLAFGKLPFQGDSKLSILFGKYEMPLGHRRPAAMCDLIRALLTPDPAQRPDITQTISLLERVRQALTSQVVGQMPASTPAPSPQQLLTTSATLPAQQAPSAPMLQQQALATALPQPQATPLLHRNSTPVQQAAQPVRQQHEGSNMVGDRQGAGAASPRIPSRHAAARSAGSQDGSLQGCAGGGGRMGAQPHQGKGQAASSLPSGAPHSPAVRGHKPQAPATGTLIDLVVNDQDSGGASLIDHLPVPSPPSATAAAGAAPPAGVSAHPAQTYVQQQQPLLSHHSTSSGPAAKATPSKGPGHRKSLSKQSFEPFEPGWGDAPAFNTSSGPGGGGGGASDDHWGDSPAFGSSSLPAPFASASASAAAAGSGLGQQQPGSKPPAPSPPTGAGDGTLAGRLGAVSAHASSRASPLHSRSNSVDINGQAPGHGLGSAPGSSSQALPSFEADSLRVQLKAVTATAHSLSTRVRALEDLVAQQAQAITALQLQVAALSGAGVAPVTAEGDTATSTVPPVYGRISSGGQSAGDAGAAAGAISASQQGATIDAGSVCWQPFEANLSQAKP